jgi:hypothetical protein
LPEHTATEKAGPLDKADDIRNSNSESRCALCPDKNYNLETPRQDCRWSSSQKSDGDSALKHWGTLWGLRIATALRVDGWIQIEDIRQHTV